MAGLQRVRSVTRSSELAALGQERTPGEVRVEAVQSNLKLRFDGSGVSVQLSHHESSG
jgi:hypothetical protein